MWKFCFLLILCLLSYAVAETPVAPSHVQGNEASSSGAIDLSEEARRISGTELESLRPKRVLIVMAMREEALPLIKKLGLKEKSGVFDPREPMRAYEGKVGNIEVALVINGQSFRPPKLDLTGPAAAATTTNAAIKVYQPDLVISAGTAGGMASSNAKVGDVFLSNKIVYHDRKIPLGPDWERYALGDHAHVKVDKAAKALELKVGAVATGSSFVNVSTSDLSVINREKAAVVEMEAAAVAEKAADYGIKMIAIKSVTDLVERPDISQFPQNFEKATNALTQKVADTLQYLQR